MPTQPFEPLLNRDMSKILPGPILETASPALQETVNYATNLYERCRASSKGVLEEALPMLVSYLHMIQMTDSVEVLVSNGCGAPAELLLRSSFEGKLTIQYIHESNSRKRAIAWLVQYYAEEIEWLEKAIPSHPKAEEFRRTWERDGLAKIADPPPLLPEAAETIQRLRATLERPDYAVVYSRYKEQKDKRERRPEWYSLYHGPQNLRELAEYLRQGTEYELLYRYWSRISHAKDMSHLSWPLEDGSSILGPIRNPLKIVHVATRALSYLLEATQLMVEEYRPDELRSYTKWWAQEVREKHVALVKLEIGGRDWFYEKFVPKRQ